MKKIEKLIHFGRVFTRKVNRDRVRAHSAESAFFIIMSFFPIVMLLLTLIQFTPLDPEQVLQLLEEITPFEIRGIWQNLVGSIFHSASSILPWTILVALWSAGKGMMGISDGLNSIYHVTERKNYFVIRIRSACYTFVLILALIVSLGILVFGYSIQRFLQKHFPIMQQYPDSVLIVPAAIAMVILVLLFMIMYAFLPNRRMPFWGQLPGALFTAISWALFSYAFSIYLELAVNMSVIYGSLTTLVVVMLWLYVCMYLLFLGAEVNDYLARPEQFLM